MQAPCSTLHALILEDEPRYREFLAEVLREMNLSSSQAGSASEARRLIAARAPDILLLDLNLPLVDGLAFLREFRERCPETPVVIITGFGDLAAAREAIRLGVSDFLSKPCDLGELEDAIGRARRRLGRDEGKPALAALPTEDEEKDAAAVRSLAVIEREAILEALRASGGNRSEAARQLGISRRALYNKIGEYEREGFEIP